MKPIGRVVARPVAARASAGDDGESESKPAATMASGRASGQEATNGKHTTSGELTTSRGRHPGSSNGKATARAATLSAPKRQTEGTAALLERAGLKMAEAPAVGAEDRQSQFAKFQIDAPACDNCGSITVRNGNCYLCHNCGNSMGCS